MLIVLVFSRLRFVVVSTPFSPSSSPPPRIRYKLGEEGEPMLRPPLLARRAAIVDATAADSGSLPQFCRKLAAAAPSAAMAAVRMIGRNFILLADGSSMVVNRQSDTMPLLKRGIIG